MQNNVVNNVSYGNLNAKPYCISLPILWQEGREWIMTFTMNGHDTISPVRITHAVT